MASAKDKLKKRIKSEPSTKKTEIENCTDNLYGTIKLPESIHISLIEPNPNNIREIDTENEAFSELVESIKDIGLQQNLVVYKKVELDENGNNRYVLLTGHRRLAAIKKIHEEHPTDKRYMEVPCLVQVIKGDETLGISPELEEKMLNISTNTNIESLNRKEMLKAIRIALEYAGKKHPEKRAKEIITNEASQNVGLSSRQVKDYITFDEKLIPEFKEAFFETKSDGKQLTFRIAKYLSRQSEGKQFRLFKAFKDSLDDMSIAACEEILKENQKFAAIEPEASRKREETAFNNNDFHQYPALPDEIYSKKIMENNGKRRFVKPDHLDDEALEVMPISDISLITPIEISDQKTKLGKTAYRKYITAMNQINKQLCVISDLINEINEKKDN